MTRIPKLRTTEPRERNIPLRCTELGKILILIIIISEILSPELSNKHRSVGHIQPNTEPTENPTQEEGSEAWREGDDEPAEKSGNIGGQDCSTRSDPAPAVTTQEAPDNLANIVTAG